MKTAMQNKWNFKTSVLGTLFIAGSMLSMTSTTQAAPVLVNQSYVQNLPEESFTALLTSCYNNLGYVASPVATMDDGDHYSSSGANTSVTKGKLLSDDALVAYQASLCYLRTGDIAYANNAQNILDAWSNKLTKVPTPQGKNGINFSMPYMIMSASWVQGVGGWNDTNFKRFVKTVVLPASNSQFTNNHGAWGVLLNTSAAAYLDDNKGLDAARIRWKSLVAGATNQWGYLPQEVDRSGTSNYHAGPDKGIKGLAYTHYFMMPATIAAKILADEQKWVLTTTEGALFQLAYNKAALWTRYPVQFPYYASNNGKLDGVRNAAYFSILSKTYSNPNATVVLNDGNLGANGFKLLELFPTQ